MLKIPTAFNVLSLKSHLFLSLFRFSMPTLMPQRWFSIGSHSQSWPASYESDLKRGRMALHCGSSFTAVRLRVRKMKHLLLQSFSDFFWPPHGTHSCENTIVVLPNFTPGQKVGHSKNNSLRKHFLEEMWNGVFFHLHLYNLMINNSLTCQSIQYFYSYFPFCHLSLLLSHAHSTPTLMCTHTHALAVSYTYPPSLSPTHPSHTHTQKETHCPNRIILECDVWVITSESNRLSAFICSPGKQTRFQPA